MSVSSSGRPELGANVASLDEYGRRSLPVGAGWQKHERGVDPVEVVERVERELEGLAAKQLPAGDGRLAFGDRARGAEPAERVHDGVRGVDGVDVVGLGASGGRVRPNRDGAHLERWSRPGR